MRFDLGDNKHTFRPVQDFARRQLEEHWDDYDIFILPYGVGTGKSALGRMVQVAFLDKKTCYITPQNNLIRQVKDDYPEVNAVMGRAQYICHTSDTYSTSKEVVEFSCEDIYNINESKLCATCTYSKARMNEYKRKDTVYNVFSYMDCISKKGEVVKERVGDINIVDEADACLQIIKDFAGLQISVKKFSFDNEKIDDAEYIVEWLRDVGEHFEIGAKNENDYVKKSKLFKKADKFFNIASSLETDWDLYAVELKETKRSKTLDIKPMDCPVSIIKKLLGKEKTVFMSATIFKEDLEAFENMGYRVKTLAAESAIPAVNRTIFYENAYGGAKASTVDPDLTAQAIKKLVCQVKHSHTLVHTTYSKSTALAAALRDVGLEVLVHDKLDKTLVIEQWKHEGGILLGCGCDTGLDLKDDLCRLNIVTSIRFPSLGSKWVKKRMEWQNGRRWYMMEALRFLMQAFGRGVRGPNDWCVNVCLDKNIGWVIDSLLSMGVDVPLWFTESIKYFPEDEDIGLYLKEFKKEI